MGTTTAEMITSIKTSLKNLYETPLERIQAGDREAHFAKIKDLEASLDRWESKESTSTSQQSGVKYSKLRFGDSA